MSRGYRLCEPPSGDQGVSRCLESYSWTPSGVDGHGLDDSRPDRRVPTQVKVLQLIDLTSLVRRSLGEGWTITRGEGRGVGVEESVTRPPTSTSGRPSRRGSRPSRRQELHSSGDPSRRLRPRPPLVRDRVGGERTPITFLI